MGSERIVNGEQRVKADQWDIDGWQMLASEADEATFAIAKPVYERLVAQFPPSGRFWKSYIEHFSREEPDNHDEIKNLYERALLAAPTSIELWRSYVSFASSLALKVPGSKLESDAIATYERALAVAGLDLNAHPLWSHYIDFLKNHTTQSDSHRRDALRRVYQRAVRNPMQNLDAFWRDYNTFEQNNNTNKELVRGLIAENQPKNIDARTEFRARRTRREALTINALPLPPRGRPKEFSQAQQWRRFVAHERENPFSLSAPDLHGRIIHALECALAPLYRYPDMWLAYLSYMYETLVKDQEPPPQKGGNKEAAATAKEDATLTKAVVALEPLLERAIKALPEHVALHTYVNWLYVHLKMPAKGIAALETLVKTHPSPLAYVHLMRAVRRGEGQNKARKLFGRARKDPKGNDPVVYTAAALIEFTVNKDPKVARNVFEFGLKQHPKSAVMTMEFVKWLWGIPDLEYARVILKKVMPDVIGSPDEVRELWEKWLDLEEIIGDAKSVDEVEKLWMESDANRVNSVMQGVTRLVQDVSRRARFLSCEGFREHDLSSIEGLRTAVTEKSVGGNGAVSGKRDPRTGRRVVSSGAGKDGNAVLTPSARRGAEAASQSSVMKVATEWLHRMAAGFAHLEPPPILPTPKDLFQMIRDIPDEFSSTPAGVTEKSASRNKQQPDNITGKKRKGEEDNAFPRSRPKGANGQWSIKP